MTVLFLGPRESLTRALLQDFGENVIDISHRLSPDSIAQYEPEFIVSHGYRHILKPDVLELVPGVAINLHISFLPWNRGADPNLWSWIDGTPKGVTIHYIDEGVDTGDIIAQRIVEFGEGGTLATTYARLQAEIIDLFKQEWPLIRAGRCGRKPQPTGGTMHLTRDRVLVDGLITAGWRTPVAALSRGDLRRA